MTRILLIRHGSTDAMLTHLCGRTPGIHLSEDGRNEARAVGRSLQESCVLQTVYSSPLERAVETAGQVAAAQKIDVRVESAWNEIDFGSWQGLTFAELDELSEWKQFNSYRSLSDSPNGESILAVQARVAKAVSDLQTRHPDSSIAVVTHGDVIRALLMHLLGMPSDHILRIEISPASVSAFSIAPGHHPVIHYLNLHAS